MLSAAKQDRPAWCRAKDAMQPEPLEWPAHLLLLVRRHLLEDEAPVSAVLQPDAQVRHVLVPDSAKAPALSCCRVFSGSSHSWRCLLEGEGTPRSACDSPKVCRYSASANVPSRLSDCRRDLSNGMFLARVAQPQCRDLPPGSKKCTSPARLPTSTGDGCRLWSGRRGTCQLLAGCS